MFDALVGQDELIVSGAIARLEVPTSIIFGRRRIAI